MKVVIGIEIDCGETTCSPEAGKFCPKMFVTNFGTRFLCAQFRDELGRGTELSDEQGIPSGPGWLQRLPECMSAEVYLCPRCIEGEEKKS